MVAEQWESAFPKTVDLYRLQLFYVKEQSSIKDFDALTD